MEWKQYNNKYSVSECGDVRNDVTNKVLKPDPHYRGYLRVTLHGKHKLIHRLVCSLWHDNPENKPEVNHLDGNKSNNHYTNLCWSTSKENNRHAISLGLTTLRMIQGENHFNAKLSNDDALAIKQSKGKLSAKALSHLFNIPAINIYKIWDGSMWKHI